MEKPVAVLGGGACAQTFAAEFTLAGYIEDLTKEQIIRYLRAGIKE